MSDQDEEKDKSYDPLDWQPNPSSGVYDYDDYPVDPASVFGGGSKYPASNTKFDKFMDKWGCLLVLAFFLAMAIVIKIIAGV
jgi:hypothetical protein